MDELLTPEILLHAYQMGIFPMADPRGLVHWYSPDPRCVFEYERFRVPRSLRPVIRKQKFQIRVNTAFEQVIDACASRPEGTWISREFAEIYRELRRRGLAHSVEAWRDRELAGGLYGVALGGAFFGESMFYHVSDASKVALVALVERLEERGFRLIDTQWSTPHLLRFGAVEIPRPEYLKRLDEALTLPCRFDD